MVNLVSKVAGHGVAEAVKGVAGVFRENREARGVRGHEQNMAVLGQYAAEFMPRDNRTWFDSLSDGLNRLVRPLFAIACFLSLIAVPVWPERALYAAEALAAMPDGYWLLVGLVVTFYFGGRMQLKSQNFKLKSGAIEAARNIATIRDELLTDEAHPDEEIYDAIMADERKPMPNWAIAEWNRRNANEG